MNILAYITDTASDGIVGTIATVVTPILTTIAGYFAGRRKRNNDFLSDLQKSIDMLAEKNTMLMKDVLDLRTENANLSIQVRMLTRQNEELRKELEVLNAKLENVKTITRTK